PKLQAAGKAHFVKFEIRRRAGIAAVATPDLARGDRIADESADRALAAADRVIPVRRAALVLFAPSPRRSIGLERLASFGEVRVHHREVIAGLHQMRFDPGAHSRLDAGKRRPETRGPVRALRKPASPRRATERALMLGAADQELESDALVAREER